MHLYFKKLHQWNVKWNKNRKNDNHQRVRYIIRFKHVSYYIANSMKAAPQKYILYYPSVINKIPITLYFRFVSFSKVPLAHLMIFFFLGNLLLSTLHCFYSLLWFFSCQEGAKENGIDFIDQKKIYNKNLVISHYYTITYTYSSNE